MQQGMKRRPLLVLIAILGASAVALGVAAHAFAGDAEGAAGGAPPHPHWEGRRVPIEPSMTLEAAPPAPSSSAPPAHSPARRTVPPFAAPESGYDSCRRGFYERGLPYDFLACEHLR